MSHFSYLSHYLFLSGMYLFDREIHNRKINCVDWRNKKLRLMSHCYYLHHHHPFLSIYSSPSSYVSFMFYLTILLSQMERVKERERERVVRDWGKKKNNVWCHTNILSSLFVWLPSLRICASHSLSLCCRGGEWGGEKEKTIWKI